MSNYAEELFQKLQTPSAIRGLIGFSEEAHFDCKEWPSNDGDAQKVFAKAACGLTNADGGAVIVGMRARPTSKDEPDLVDSAAPVADTSVVKSRILDLVGQLVEPGIEGVRAAEVNEPIGARTGFVVIYVPASDGPPRRSRKDWKFYQRIGSGTFPMEYFQIEERFGKRPPPKLELHLEAKGIGGKPSSPGAARHFVLGIKNIGRGLARFPSIRYRRTCGLVCDQFGIDGNGGVGLPLRPSEPEWVVFRGGIDDVIYPQEVRKITKLWQDATAIGSTDRQFFKAVSFQCEISSEGTPTFTVEESIPAY